MFGFEGPASERQLKSLGKGSTSSEKESASFLTFVAWEGVILMCAKHRRENNRSSADTRGKQHY